MYEGGIRVPGIIEWPGGISAPATSGVLSVTSDMLPTLCAIAGIDPPGRPIDGIDLSPLVALIAIQLAKMLLLPPLYQLAN